MNPKLNYIEFRKILAPAIEILKAQNEEYKNLSGENLLEFNSVTNEEILAFESSFNVKIPKFYKSFLKEFNPSRAEIMFCGILGFEEIQDVFVNIGYSEHLIEANCIPIISDNSGNYYCIKYNENILFLADHENRYELSPVGNVLDQVSQLVEYKISNSK